MSNLLNKNKNENKPKKIDRVESTPPSKTYNQNNVFTVSNKNKKKEIEPTTSIRLSVKNRTKLNALVTQQGLDSVDQVLNQIIEHYVNTLSASKKKEWETLYKIYSKKEKK